MNYWKYIHAFAVIYALVGTCLYTIAIAILKTKGLSSIKGLTLSFDVKTIVSFTIYFFSIAIALNLIS